MSKASKKILVVEDERPTREALVDKLVKEGYTVFQGKNGEEGLRVALNERPDLILLDVIMPKMDGLTMLEKLKEDDWGKNVPVVMLTVLNTNQALAKAVEEGAYDFLIKSDWKLEDVVKKVKEVLNK